MSRAKLLEAVNLFETTLDQSARLGNERLDGHRREAIQLRRVLSTQTADIAQLGGEEWCRLQAAGGILTAEHSCLFFFIFNAL